jgi:hypothetical protein
MAYDADLAAAIEARTGQPVDADWLEQASAEAMAYVRLMAPCKKSEWTDFASLPPDVQAIFVAALARSADNPRGIKQETIGEYSYTLVSGAGSSSTGPFSPSEQRIITSSSGCGGAVKSVAVTMPELRPLAVPYQED